MRTSYVFLKRNAFNYVFVSALRLVVLALCPWDLLQMLEFGQRRFGVMEGKQAVISSLVFVLLELGSTINTSSYLFLYDS
jgi:hypothetical protein